MKILPGIRKGRHPLGWYSVLEFSFTESATGSARIALSKINKMYPIGKYMMFFLQLFSFLCTFISLEKYRVMADGFCSLLFSGIAEKKLPLI